MLLTAYEQSKWSEPTQVWSDIGGGWAVSTSERIRARQDIRICGRTFRLERIARPAPPGLLPRITVTVNLGALPRSLEVAVDGLLRYH